MCIAVLDGLFVTYDFRTVRGDFGFMREDVRFHPL
jgi:hypothetical protein